MYILINKDKTEINENYVTSNLKLAKAPAGWEWIDAEDPLVPKIKAKMKVRAYAENRKTAYEREGITTEALVVALWEKIVEGRSEAATELQTKRSIIKEKYPKEVNG